MTITKDEIIEFLQQHIEGCCGHGRYTMEEIEDDMSWDTEFKLEMDRRNKEVMKGEIK